MRGPMVCFDIDLSAVGTTVPGLQEGPQFFVHVSEHGEVVVVLHCHWRNGMLGGSGRLLLGVGLYVDGAVALVGAVTGASVVHVSQLNLVGFDLALVGLLL